MKKLHALLGCVCALLCLPSSLRAQQYFQVSGTVVNIDGSPVGNAVMSWTPVLAPAGPPLLGGLTGGAVGTQEQFVGVAKQVQIPAGSGGGFTPFNLVNTAVSYPQNFCYHVVIQDGASGDTIFDYPCVQFDNSSANSWCDQATPVPHCYFDQYHQPNYGPLAAATPGPAGPAGATGATGPAGPAGASGSALAGRQTVSYSFAASNSVNASVADYKGTGTGDDAMINAAIGNCPSATAGQPGPVQCVLSFQPGIYHLANPIVIDNDDITLTGEGHCMWGGALYGGWTGTSSPAGTVGTGCAQFVSTVSGMNLIEIRHNNLAGNGYSSTGGDQQRHRGLMIKWLYLVGYNFTGTGIKSLCGSNAGCKTVTTNGVTSTGYSDDNSFILDNVIQNTADGVNVVWDTADIEQNSIQSIGGNAIVTAGSFGRITNNLIFDIGGSGVLTNTNGQMIANNLIGSTNAYGIYAVGQGSFTGNQLFITRTGAIKAVGMVGGAITGNQINYPGGYGGTPTGDAISIDAASSNVAVTGNSLNTSASIAGYAINDAGTYGAVSGNTTAGAWNSGGVPINLDSTNQTIQDGGAGNVGVFVAGSQPGVRYFSADAAGSNKPSMVLSDGATNGILFQSYSGYGKPMVGFNGPNGGAFDLGLFRSVQSDANGNIDISTRNGAGGGAVSRIHVQGGASGNAVQIPSGPFQVGAVPSPYSGSMFVRATAAAEDCGIDTSGGTDAKVWCWDTSGGSLLLRAVNDAATSATTAATFTRTGATATGVTFGVPITSSNGFTGKCTSPQTPTFAGGIATGCS